MTTTAYFEISKTSAGTLENVETKFRVFPPVNRFTKFATQATGLGGLVVARGLPYDVWRWDFISLASYELFMTFCPAASVQIWVRDCKSRKISQTGEYGYYTGVFTVPERNTYRIKDDLVYPWEVRLDHLVEYTP